MTKLTRFTGLASLALGLAFFPACSPPWQVVRLATPDPFLGHGVFAIDGIRYEGLRVGGKSEGEYVANKDPKAAASFEGDKQGIAQAFIERLAASGTGRGLQMAAIPMGQQPPPGAFIVRANCDGIEPGNFNGFVNIPTTVHMAVQILDPSGANVLDEFVIAAQVAASIYNPASGGRERSAAVQLGDVAARYLASRVNGQ